MENLNKHKWIWRIIVIISAVALIATSVLPFLSL